MGDVRIAHPDLPGQEVTVPASAVPIHRAAGWVPVEGQQDMGEEWPLELQPFEGQPLVTMRHPDLPDQEITVASSAVPIHRSSGWLVVEDEAAAAEPEPEPEPEAEPAAEAEGKPRRRGKQQEAPAEPATTKEA